MRTLLGSLLILSSVCLCCRATAADLPPVTRFTNFAQYETMKISPGGTQLALTRRTSQHEEIIVLRLPDLKLSGGTHFGDLIDIQSFHWANESRLLISPARRFPGFISYKAPTGEIIGLDASARNGELLFGPMAGQKQVGTLIKQRESTYAAGVVLDRLAGRSDSVLIQTYGYGIEGEYNGVFRMDVRNGRLKKIVGSPVRNGTFLTDLEQRVALVFGEDRTGREQVFHWVEDPGEWKLLVDTQIGEGTLVPVAPSGKPGEFYVLDNRDAPTRGVFTWTPATGEQQLLYRHADADVEGAEVDPLGRPWVFEYVDHFPGYWYPDPQHPLAQVHQWLRKAFAEDEVDITSETDDMSLAVARISNPRKPPVFLVVDVKQRKAMQQLVSRPDLKTQDLAMVEPIEFAARDGLKIRGYLTTPNGTTPNGPQKKQLPMIVMVHGGPHGIRDRYEFDWEVQLLASRGYAVLQVNYRGSAGRGRKFAGAGFGRWGREMQDDITDGVKWAIGDGVADRKRICIYGGSYGAYAALTGAFREPDLFRCAVGMAGVYDLPLMFEKGDIQSVLRGVNYLKLAVGTETEELKRRSPVYNAGKIRAAVLLLHGKQDERAPFEHAKRMREALEKAGNPPEWYTEWGEGHGFFDEANRVAAYERMLAFFGKHVGAAQPPSP